MLNIEWVGCHSRNYAVGRAGCSPIAIVIHIAQGSIEGTKSWFQDPKSDVSSHYMVGKKGEVVQFVLDDYTAYHAGTVVHPTWSLMSEVPTGLNPNYVTLGIEHEGFDHDPWSKEMYSSSAELIAELSKKHSIPMDLNHIIPHHLIRSNKTCPGFRVDMAKLIARAKTF